VLAARKKLIEDRSKLKEDKSKLRKIGGSNESDSELEDMDIIGAAFSKRSTITHPPKPAKKAVKSKKALDIIAKAK